jgi:integrase
MRIDLKGIHAAHVKLADGSVKIYYYAWRGGPRLRSEPGTPDFIASFNEAVEKRDPEPNGTLQYLDYAWTVLARILSVAKDRGKIAVNPCEKGGRLYDGTRVDFVWSIEDETAFLKHAPAHLHLPLLLALWTGQRQGDLLLLSWSAYDGTHIRLRQSKSRRRGARPAYVNIPVGAPLRVALDTAAKNKHSTLILVNSDGRPWTPDGFRASWGKACKKAGIEEVTFNDLRGTAVTRLALVGCTEAEIAAITGHSLRDVRSILDAHYLHRDQALAESAIRKLEMGYAQCITEAKTGTESG